jgi:hypothetical protein
MDAGGIQSRGVTDPKGDLREAVGEPAYLIAFYFLSVLNAPINCNLTAITLFHIFFLIIAHSFPAVNEKAGKSVNNMKK